MLIMTEEKAAFIHIPKTAGQSVAAALGYEHRPEYHHINDVDQTEGFFRFCIVRDPVDRFVSAYAYSTQMARAGGASVEQHPVRQFIIDHGLGDSVDRFALAVREHGFPVLNSVHFRPQMHWIRRGRPQYIGRLETLTEDLNRILRVLGRPGIEAMPERNRSEVTPDSRRLGPEARAYVEELYDDDLRLLGYG